MTVGRFDRKHHVVPGAAVTGVEDGAVNVALSRAEIEPLPDLAHPDMKVDEQLVHAIEYAYARTGGFTGP